jgi:SPP1 gp7 family putative phage head morphogenesis protein
MTTDKVNVYDACDKAIKSMNRENVEAFGRLKLSKWDSIHIIRTVTTVYRESARKARKRYFEIAYEVYLLMLLALEIPAQKANSMAKKAITMEWVDEILKQTDFVTLYRFDSEMERKAQRLAETLEATQERDAEIDKALKYWSKQLGQYAINFTDYAAMQAFEDADVKQVMWMTQRDERVCEECSALNGLIFPLDEVPAKPHMNCRCFWKVLKD